MSRRTGPSGDGARRFGEEIEIDGEDPVVTGKTAFAHRKEFPDSCTRLERMEAAATREQASAGSARLGPGPTPAAVEGRKRSALRRGLREAAVESSREARASRSGARM